MRRFLAALALLLILLPAMAQDSPSDTTPEEERSFFTNLLENQLSTPNRRIRISGIQGALSSQATIGEISIADREGVWLRIVNASIDWSRSTLILRQRLEVQRLAAERIEFLRRPLPAKGLPAPESRSFAIPELPLAVDLQKLEVPSAAFGEDVFGLAAELALDGALRIDGGTLDTNFDIRRLDGPGGQFALAAAFSNETRVLDLDLTLDEPADGVVANLLNVEGRPPLKLTLSGSGPLSALDLKLSLEADGVPTFGGTAQFRQRDEGLGFSARLAGAVARLLPAQFRDFFGAGTTITLNGLSKAGGGVLLENLRVASAAMRLEAAAETGSDGFLTALSLDARLADPDGSRVLLPVAGGQTSLQTAAFNVTFGEAGAEHWNGRLDIDGLQTAEFAAGRTQLTMGGLARNLDRPAERHISFSIDGGLSQITARREDIAQALGEALSLTASGDWRAGTPVAIENAGISGNGLAIMLKGAVDQFVFDGEIDVSAASLTPFSALAGQDLGGAIDLKATGKVMPIGGGFDLVLDGTATDLEIENEVAGNLLAGITRIDGGVGRSPEGLTARELRLTNDQVTLSADGTFASSAANFLFEAELADMASLSPRASGPLTASGRARGTEGRINLTFNASAPRGELVGRDLTEGLLGFDGLLDAGTLTGRLSGNAFLAGERVELAGDVLVGEERRQLSNLSFRAGGASANGTLSQGANGLIEGQVAVDAADISTAAALFLRQASGALQAEINLQPQDGRQSAEANATLRDLRVENTLIGSGDLAATVDDLFGVPVVAGTIAAQNIKAGNLDIDRFDAEADHTGETTSFSGTALLAVGTRIETRGTLAPQDSGYRIGLEQLSLAQGSVAARLLEPTSLLVQGDNFTLEPFNLDVAGGRVSAAGRITSTLDLTVALDQVPLSIANAVRPDLALGGTLDGNARIEGSRDAPKVTFDITGRQIASALLGQAGLSTLSVDASGTTNGDRLDIDTTITSPEGLRATARGGVPLADGALSVDVALEAFPLAVLNRVARGQDLAGQLTGTARVTGRLAAPEAAFDLRAIGLSAAALSGVGLGPLQLAANGRYADNGVTLTRLTAEGPSGLSVEASGTIPLRGQQLALTIAGAAPLSIANRALAARGTQLSGSVSANATVGGSLDKPVINGTITTANAAAVDPLTNLRINDLRLAASIAGDRIAITEGSAALAAGGRVSVSGSISTDAAAGFPADLRIRLDEARHTDGEMVTATVSGALSLVGPLTRDPLLSGDLTVARAEIVVPENIAGGSAAVQVRHLNPPPAVRQTLERARADDGTPMPSARPSVMRLDVNVSAPARIFVRGRGLDAELGGTVRLTGPVTNIQPVGGFKLIRGRLSIIGQRITFDEGEVTLIGDLDPQLNFVARSRGNDIIVFITVQGRVSDLDISFSSQPELPEDEVLARLIFDRGIDELSAVQIAQLAAAAAELAGGSNTSLLGSLRNAAGLDDLDVITDSQGNAAVRAGRYIQDNIYLGVEAGAKGTTRGTVNLDITDDLKARGSLGSDGDSSLGIFFEKDY
ncbi:translocation/assembly module TamB domain-containing protein [Nitratireductor sp. ZSWI3]|uniref:translocation/assembly module TamB domain-containing protein n=1 Tax=Nitratireductor sp. ZSWI3 TaxID=2966359 RepID=UPI00214F6D72|nr:translocation/assembly module TamB domain-containing protein [Nitratireductor sp. ZSWI3]MCR4268050.1 translocation/assembly module TamB domain-containing protein [Nitratireductor sp. ZSWI3]